MLLTKMGRDIIANAMTAAAGAAAAVLVEEREAIADTGVKVVKKGAKKSKASSRYST